MIRIGVVNIDTSHPKAFNEYLKQADRARYVAIYNDGFRGDDEVEAFMRSYALERRCAGIEELADCTDIGFVQGCDWDRHLQQAMPFIERGKPVFIDKPIVGSLRDCRKLEALAAEGAVILGSSSARYAAEVTAFARRAESDRGRVMSVFGTAGVDEFNYGVHIVEAIGGLLGTGAVACRFVGRSVADDKVCETFFVRFDENRTATYTTFQGTWQPFEIVATTTTGTHQFRIDSTKLYAQLLDRICDFMETGRSDLASVPAMTESVRIMLAGRLSRAQGGAEILLESIPEDDPGYDGAVFERGYAAAATKMYLAGS